MTDCGSLAKTVSHPAAHDGLMTNVAVRAIVDAVEATDASIADTATCERMVGDLNRVIGGAQAALAGYTSRLGDLHDTAGGAPPADVLTKCGGVSAAEGKRRERRSKAIEEAPSFGEALGSGLIGAEHVDALANATAQLGDEVKDVLLAAEDELLAEAQAMSPERFGRSCRDRARRLEKDHGRERNRRQRRETFLSRRLNPATGMIEGRFSLHPSWATRSSAPSTMRSQR